MNEQGRLFDCIDLLLKKDSAADLLAGRKGAMEKLWHKRGKGYCGQAECRLLSLGVSPNDMSIEGRDKIAIMCKNRPEWIMLDLAVQQIGAVLVPVYPTISVNELEFIFNDSRVKYVFVNDEESYLKVLS